MAGRRCHGLQRKGMRPVVKLLLEKGADFESKDKNGKTPLSWAAQYGHAAIIKLLIEKGANFETRDRAAGRRCRGLQRTGARWSSNCCLKRRRCHIGR